MCRCGGLGEHGHIIDQPITKSLYEYIALDKCTVLNANQAQLQNIIKPEFNKGASLSLKSDADDQIIVHIQFSSAVKVKSLRLAAPERGTQSPSEVWLFANKVVDFTTIGRAQASQKLSCLAEPEHRGDVIDYPLKQHLFSNITELSLFLSNPRSTCTVINFLGFTGDFLNNKYAPVVTQYELKPQLSDHKSEADWQNAGHSNLGF